VRVEIDRLAATFERGRRIREGAVVALTGSPNVGKSSLFNRLLEEERAIVTPLAGTTRDAVRSSVQVEGVPLHIIDTAGLRETDDEIEKIGIERSWREIERADLVLLLVDARNGVGEAEQAILARLPPLLSRIIVHNKADLAGRPAARQSSDGEAGSAEICLSAKSGEGVELLRRELLRIAGWRPTEDVFIARARHLEALARTREHLAAARSQAAVAEFFAEELRLAQLALSSITGEFSSDDLLGEIFGRFCIGK
jgi:tRNA modification GTPase